MLGFVKTPARQLPAEVLKQGIRLRCSEGTIIYLQSEPADKAFYLKDGLIRLFMEGETGIQRTVSYIQAGNIFGEVGLMKDKSFGTGALAMVDSEVICFSKRQFLDFLENNRDFAMVCASSWAEKLWSVGAQMSSLALQDRYERVANALLYLGKRMGEPVAARPQEVTLRITHQDLADFVGMNRVTVTNILNELAAKGIIRKQVKQICIVDPAALKARTSAS